MYDNSTGKDYTFVQSKISFQIAMNWEIQIAYEKLFLLFFECRPFKCVYRFVSFFQLILDRISKGINDKVNSGSPLTKALFKFAYAYKVKWTSRGYKTPLIDKYVKKLIGK